MKKKHARGKYPVLGYTPSQVVEEDQGHPGFLLLGAAQEQAERALSGGRLCGFIARVECYRSLCEKNKGVGTCPSKKMNPLRGNSSMD